jgi:hypothetical protein
MSHNGHAQTDHALASDPPPPSPAPVPLSNVWLKSIRHDSLQRWATFPDHTRINSKLIFAMSMPSSAFSRPLTFSRIFSSDESFLELIR